MKKSIMFIQQTWLQPNLLKEGGLQGGHRVRAKGLPAFEGTEVSRSHRHKQLEAEEGDGSQDSVNQRRFPCRTDAKLGLQRTDKV